MRYVETEDGTRLAVHDRGGGPPVVLVHSWGLHHELWRSVIEPLAASGHRVVAFDRRGHGRSERPPAGYDLDTLADDLGRVLAALDLHGATLVGHSLGAAEIVRYLARHGDARVCAIALVSTTTPCPLQTPDHPVGVADLAALEAMWGCWAAGFPAWLRENVTAFAPQAPRATHEWLVREASRLPAPIAIACHRAAMCADQREELRRIRVPALVVHGTQDVSSPLHATGGPTAAALPGAALELYEGAAHGLLLTHADRLVRDVRALAAGAPRRPAAPAGV